MSVEILFLAQFVTLATCLGFPFDRIPPPPTTVFLPQRSVELDGERVRAKIRGRRATVALHPGNGGSAIHEAGHWLLRARDGDPDAGHVRTKDWACVDTAQAAPAFGDLGALPFYTGRRGR